MIAAVGIQLTFVEQAVDRVVKVDDLVGLAQLFGNLLAVPEHALHVDQQFLHAEEDRAIAGQDIKIFASQVLVELVLMDLDTC